MTSTPDTQRSEWAELGEENREIWNTNAWYWDERMGDGNDFQTELVAPATERLLRLQPDELILEAACGNGAMARRLADLGARVIAFDTAPDMIRRAEARGRGPQDRIDFRVLDAADHEALLGLGEGRFDAVICNMAIMDMAQIDPLFSAIPRLLRKGGRFVFTLCHPCFNSTGISKLLEEQEIEGRLVDSLSVRVHRYKGAGPELGLAMIGQPRPQYYFNRTLEQVCNACFRAGMSIDGLEEPAFETHHRDRLSLSWTSFSLIPPVLAVRARPPTEFADRA